MAAFSPPVTITLSPGFPPAHVWSMSPTAKCIRTPVKAGGPTFRPGAGLTSTLPWLNQAASKRPAGLRGALCSPHRCKEMQGCTHLLQESRWFLGGASGSRGNLHGEGV